MYYQIPLIPESKEDVLEREIVNTPSAKAEGFSRLRGLCW